MSDTQVILLAEEDPQYAFLVQLALQQAGVRYPLQLVSRRRDVIDYLSGNGRYASRPEYPLPTLIILGVRLPLLGNFKGLRWIRSHAEFEHIPIVVLSGMRYDDEARVARQLGADYYRVKPPDFHALVRIAEHIRDRWLRAVRYQVAA